MAELLSEIAGPNGAGKTTFARAFLPEEAHCARFINADLIAAGLSPFAPESMAIARVAERVKQGGHHIAADVIRRRFDSGKRNFDLHYRYVVDAWSCYDNSGNEPTMLAWGEQE
jgi:predicted ABC-type ATPase